MKKRKGRSARTTRGTALDRYSHRGRGRRFGTLLVDIHPGLLLDLGDEQGFDGRKPCEIRQIGVERVDHAEGLKVVVERAFIAHAKTREEEPHFFVAEPVGDVLPFPASRFATRVSTLTPGCGRSTVIVNARPPYGRSTAWNRLSSR